MQPHLLRAAGCAMVEMHFHIPQHLLGSGPSEGYPALRGAPEKSLHHLQHRYRKIHHELPKQKQYILPGLVGEGFLEEVATHGLLKEDKDNEDEEEEGKMRKGREEKAGQMLEDSTNRAAKVEMEGRREECWRNRMKLIVKVRGGQEARKPRFCGMCSKDPFLIQSHKADLITVLQTRKLRLQALKSGRIP